MTSVSYIQDGEWALVGHLAIYPREDGTFSIGRQAGAQCWRDLDGQTGFENIGAAVDQAQWLVETPDILRKLWW